VNTDSIAISTSFLQLLSMSGQDDYFDMVIADRLNKMHVPVSERCEGVREAITLLEKFYDREVAARGGTLSAAALTDIMERGISSLAV
jgi:hypothetical protein